MILKRKIFFKKRNSCEILTSDKLLTILEKQKKKKKFWKEKQSKLLKLIAYDHFALT